MHGMFPAMDKEIRKRNYITQCSLFFMFGLFGSLGGFVCVPVGSLFPPLTLRGCPFFPCNCMAVEPIENPAMPIKQHFVRSSSENWQILRVFFSDISWCHPEPLVHPCCYTLTNPLKEKYMRTKNLKLI